MQPMLLTILAALVGGEPATTAEDPVTAATTTVANQHVAVSVLSAMYYCEHKRWPESVGAVQMFHQRSKFPLPVKPDWAMLSAEGSRYTINQDTLTLTTGANAIVRSHKVTSTNKPDYSPFHRLDCANMASRVVLRRLLADRGNSASSRATAWELIRVVWSDQGLPQSWLCLADRCGRILVLGRRISPRAWAGGLTIHSSLTRFAARLNSGVRRQCRDSWPTLLCRSFFWQFRS